MVKQIIYLLYIKLVKGFSGTHLFPLIKYSLMISSSLNIMLVLLSLHIFLWHSYHPITNEYEPPNDYNPLLFLWYLFFSHSFLWWYNVKLCKVATILCSAGSTWCLFMSIAVWSRFHLVLGWCLFIWRAKWSDLANDLSHTLHLKGFAPVCFLMWRVSSSERAKCHWQLWKWQR